jgi:hypothetical protein
MSGLISYITSPEITINDNSCLTITAAYISTKLNIRVSSFDGEMYTVLYQGPWQFVEMTIQVNVSAGYYKGFTIETRSEKVFDRHFVLIKEISLTDNVCEGEIICLKIEYSRLLQLPLYIFYSDKINNDF